MYDDDRDALGAEYVLGTLSAEEREQAEALLTLDSSFAEIVRIWEHRLGELNVMVEAVEPPPDLWEKIKTEIDSTRRSDETDLGSAEVIGESTPQSVPTALADTALDDTPEPGLDLVPDLLSDRPKDLDDSDRPKDLEEAERTDLDEASLVNALASTLLPSTPPPLPSTPPPNFDISTPQPSALPMPETGTAGAGADIVALRRGVRRWRGLTMAIGAIAALLAAYVALTRLAPGFITAGHQSQPAVAAPTQLPGSRLVAVLQQEPTAPAFLLTLDARERTMTVRRLTAAPDSGRSYELWLFSSKLPKPASLGAVGADEFTSRPIPAGVDVESMRSATYGISLEPAGGSQSGAPTGPMLFRGRMVEALPGSPG
jgi:anti-sigma-K factor RskA